MTQIPPKFKDAPKFGKLMNFSVYHTRSFPLASELPIIVTYIIYCSLC